MPELDRKRGLPRSAKIGGTRVFCRLPASPATRAFCRLSAMLAACSFGLLLAVGVLPSAPASAAKPASDRSPDRYEVFALPKEHPDDGPRSIEVDPALLGGEASPFGWHDTDGILGAEYTVTRGNNVHAYTDTDADNLPDPGSAPDGGPLLDFLFPLDLGDPPAAYRPAAVTNAFYWFNTVHDILYRHGFDEAAGNFQENNYGHGGLGGDPVLVELQDGFFTNGVTVSTPPDGQSPRIQLGIFTLTDPDRDSAFSSFVNIYTYAMAASQRLVGVDCLGAAETAGMLVGWSDWIALVLTANPVDLPETARGVGTYLFGQPPAGPGIRAEPYSTDFAINPLTYDSIKTLAAPFGTGNVWATALWQVYWELVAEHGYNPDLYGDWQSGGNNLALRLIMDGLKLAPCRPGFVDGRDAILLADENLNGGADRCALWRGFAARGLGSSAVQGSPHSLADGSEAFDLPADCLSTGVAEGGPSRADFLVLTEASRPNPFAARSALRYALRETRPLRLSVHDVQGRRVATLFDGVQGAGEHEASWNGRRDDGELAASGVYFLRFESLGSTRSVKVVLAR